MHHNLGHKPKSVLIRILRGARADPELIKAVRLFRCENCTQLEKPHKALPAAAPGRYMFNYEIIVDVFEEHDAAGNPFLFLSIVCDGTVFHLVTVVAEGVGQPTSTACFRKFMKTWVSWANWPKVVSSDRGLHNRGNFAKGLEAHGVYLRQAGLENPEGIARGERHGGMWKETFRKIVKVFGIIGKQQVKLATSVVNPTKNGEIRHGGFTPEQWVVGKSTRVPGSMIDEDEFGQLGVLENAVDPQS